MGGRGSTAPGSRNTARLKREIKEIKTGKSDAIVTAREKRAEIDKTKATLAKTKNSWRRQILKDEISQLEYEYAQISKKYL